MRTPPPVSGEDYSTAIGAEARSNYLYAGFTVNTAYTDNVLAGTTTNPVGDTSYSIWPTIAIDQTTPRLHQTFTYRPGFTIYQHTSSLNETDQNLAFDLQYRLSPHLTATVRDSFRKSSNVFNQSYPFTGEGISGSAQSPLVPVVAPFADQLSNNANAEITYQFARNGMFGASGTFTNLHYPDPSQAPGLSDSSSRGGAGFYSYRLTKAQYLGATYQYSQMLGSLAAVDNGAQTGAESDTRTHALLAFYTVYLKPNLSLSLSGGPQHYEVSEAPFPTIRSWAPAATASMGWQGSRTTFAVSYAHVISGGGGLVGAFDSNSANVSAGWQVARAWTVGPMASYASTKNVSPFLIGTNPGGHMISGTIAVRHRIGERFGVEFGYQRLHQSYRSIAVVSNAPDTDRGYMSISYQLTRPLGR
ncbi:hypothetical protein H7849_05885 [Alloacidobacterium dinghuense]|uniref:Uncharacterized protein n=1 Tax=Alloacidobacterium dinghuense TaxID=2763107 RepID=A0A7G8BLQ7_9BACT|nr:hypothetical protein [Alloacidobacterium dinghuense]QNI33477.1 hypothetical protein H7849_05885 [Alloacidobacterium dinghuense]